jgi:hypothetical protein
MTSFIGISFLVKQCQADRFGLSAMRSTSSLQPLAMHGRALHLITWEGIFAPPTLEDPYTCLQQLLNTCLCTHHDHPRAIPCPISTKWVTWLESGGRYVGDLWKSHESILIPTVWIRSTVRNDPRTGGPIVSKTAEPDGVGDTKQAEQTTHVPELHHQCQSHVGRIKSMSRDQASIYNAPDMWHSRCTCRCLAARRRRRTMMAPFCNFTAVCCCPNSLIYALTLVVHARVFCTAPE